MLEHDSKVMMVNKDLSATYKSKYNKNNNETNKKVVPLHEKGGPDRQIVLFVLSPAYVLLWPIRQTIWIKIRLWRAV